MALTFLWLMWGLQLTNPGYLYLFVQSWPTETIWGLWILIPQTSLHVLCDQAQAIFSELENQSMNKLRKCCRSRDHSLLHKTLPVRIKHCRYRFLTSLHHQIRNPFFSFLCFVYILLFNDKVIVFTADTKLQSKTTNASKYNKSCLTTASTTGLEVNIASDSSGWGIVQQMPQGYKQEYVAITSSKEKKTHS